MKKGSMPNDYGQAGQNDRLKEGEWNLGFLMKRKI
jgi:hypothetical protein